MSRVNYHRVPEAFLEEAAALPAPPGASRLVLGLDLATACGYAFARVTAACALGPALVVPAQVGQWDLSAGPYDSGAIRFARLRHFLTLLRPDLVVYEDVKVNPEGISCMHPRAALARAATAGEFIGALKATVATWCEEQGVPCTGYGIGVIKKRATGLGNANKEAMINTANAAFGLGLTVEGYEHTGADNVADAAWVLLLGLEEYGEGVRPPKVHARGL